MAKKKLGTKKKKTVKVKPKLKAKSNKKAAKKIAPKPKAKTKKTVARKVPKLANASVERLQPMLDQPDRPLLTRGYHDADEEAAAKTEEE